MKGTLLTLTLVASISLAVSAPQQKDPNELDDTILQVYGPPRNTTVVDSKADNGLGGIINQVFPESTTSTPATHLGKDNTPPPKPDDCECVPYYQCREGTIVENGLGIIDIRSNFGDNDTKATTAKPGGLGPCTNYLDVCCKAPSRISQPNINDATTKPPPLMPRTGCGKRNPNGVGFRITGDKDSEAQFGEFPWMVAILKEENIGENNQKLNVYQCGGALIHKQAVLTAAHCVQEQQPSQLRIRAGEWDTQTKKEIFPHQDRTVKNIVVHEKFYSGALYNDIAILILTEPLEYAENVDVICLPDRNEVFDSSRCLASGWGKNIFGKEGRYQVILKKIDLPVVPRNTCQDRLRNTRLGKYFTLHESFICAGGEPGKDTCKGDGGSPLVCPTKRDPKTYVQAGIVAWGIGCGEDSTPGVYANVAYARDWIDEQMTFYNLDNTVYQAQPQPQA